MWWWVVRTVESICRSFLQLQRQPFKRVSWSNETLTSTSKSCQQLVPPEENAVELNGDLVWRVHFRKGYHPTSLRGVTTLIDVQFNSHDISNDGEAS